MEKYNKYHESLDIDCCNNDKKNTIPTPKNCCSDLQSNDNEILTLIKELRRDLNNLTEKVENDLNCQNKKINEISTYLKNNLNNAIRDLLDNEVFTGELQSAIENIVLSYLNANNDKIDLYIDNKFKTYVASDEFHEEVKNIVKMYL